MKIKLCVFATLLLGLVSCSDRNCTLQIGTFNNQCDLFKPELWPERLPLVRDLFDKEQFDIIGMQEPFWNQMADLERILPEYGWVGLSTDGKPSDGYWHYNPIFYRKDRLEVIEWGTFWFSETPEVPASKGWDTDTPRFCTWAHMKDLKTGRDFYEFNAHFDHRGELARVESAKMIVRKTAEIAGDTPFYFNGDLNIPESSEAYGVLAAELDDTFHTAKVRENADVPSWNGWKPVRHSEELENIDHLFISRNTKALSWKLNIDSKDGLYPSDHFPIVVVWNYAR